MGKASNRKKGRRATESSADTFVQTFQMAGERAGRRGALVLNFSHDDPIKRGDANYFSSRPERMFRLRRRDPSDFGPHIHLVEQATHVIVKQIKPGLREKRPVANDQITAEQLDAASECESTLAAIWKVIADPDGHFTVRDVLFPNERGGPAH